MGSMQSLFKRIVDIIFSIFAILLLMPLFLILSLIIYLTSEGNIIYKQIRVGKDGMYYNIYKVRSMHDNSEIQTGPVWASKKDQRVTPIGKITLAYILY